LDHADSSDDEKDVGPVAKRRPRGAAKPKKPVTQYRMKAPPPAGLTPNRRTSLDSYVDDAIDGLRRSTSQALGDVSADSPPEPARTALTPTQRRELALEVRAANASVSAPVDVALEADLERQIAEMELAAKDLEIKRAELKSPAGLPGGEDEGPSAAEIEAMEAELTRPLSAEQADAIERAYAPGSPSEIVASGKFTGQGVLEVRVYFFILVCGGD
jgi:sentrin-specific protease 1